MAGCTDSVAVHSLSSPTCPFVEESTKEQENNVMHQSIPIGSIRIHRSRALR